MIPTGFLNLTPHDTGTDRSARRRAAATTALFGGAASQSGQKFDFSKSGAPAMPTSGTGSLADLYQPAFRSEIALRDKRAARMDRLPAAVRKLASDQGVTDLPVLEVVAVICRACTTMGGNPAQCFASDIGKAIGVTTQRAEEILREAAQRGFIEPRAGNYWRCKL
ncbi:hypothetical protein [Bosea sp. ANAM02]|uniref:hypothetical protein n=1 Tax=Bosea sp. ANAM02 TaxID=2020412 RepID=UPI00140F2947|nr:hypothetical protein [Bosea sp. ANAM02]BCB17931.1 hypothetical protein OCUBac02_08250 [Bosea sp. ANAM02]